MRLAILTRNAIHGGVETILKYHQREFKCPIIVCGGLNNPLGTCPFEYEYITSYRALRERLKEFDVVMYHWIPDWALKAIKIPSIEYVHRVDTAQIDKRTPSLVMAHSTHLCDRFKGRLVPYPVDVEHYLSVEGSRDQIGAVTSYTDIKGIDIAIKAASYLKIPLKFYGSGNSLQLFKRLAELQEVQVEFNEPISDPATVFGQYKLILSPARMEGGSPLAVMEALSAGCPVVGSDIPGHLECNQMARQMGYPEPIVIFKGEDAMDMSRKIKYALDNPYDPRPFMKEFSMSKHLKAVREVVESL